MPAPSRILALRHHTQQNKCVGPSGTVLFPPLLSHLAPLCPHAGVGGYFHTHAPLRAALRASLTAAASVALQARVRGDPLAQRLLQRDALSSFETGGSSDKEDHSPQLSAAVVDQFDWGANAEPEYRYALDDQGRVVDMVWLKRNRVPSPFERIQLPRSVRGRGQQQQQQQLRSLPGGGSDRESHPQPESGAQGGQRQRQWHSRWKGVQQGARGAYLPGPASARGGSPGSRPTPRSAADAADPGLGDDGPGGAPTDGPGQRQGQAPGWGAWEDELQDTQWAPVQRL